MWLVDNEVVTRWGMLVFITFISSIWHPWLMTKWCGCPIVITMIKKWLQVIWYEHRQPYPHPTYLCTYLFTYPPTHLSTYLIPYPPNHLPITYLPIYLPTHPPAHLPLIYAPTYLSTTHLLTHLPTYLPTHPLTYLLTY
jgi:hypothetical protein